MLAKMIMVHYTPDYCTPNNKQIPLHLMKSMYFHYLKIQEQ